MIPVLQPDEQHAHGRQGAPGGGMRGTGFQTTGKRIQGMVGGPEDLRPGKEEPGMAGDVQQIQRRVQVVSSVQVSPIS